MRAAFHDQLDEISDILAEMAIAAGAAMSQATQALLNTDLNAAEAVISGDDHIDELTSEVERRCGRSCSPCCCWRRLKNSSKRSSNGVPRGRLGTAPPPLRRSGAACATEMFTTASLTCAARSAKDSGAMRTRLGAGGATWATAVAPDTASASAAAAPQARTRAPNAIFPYEPAA